MHGTICNNCKTFKPKEEEIRPCATDTKWLLLRKHYPYFTEDEDFCSKKCLMEYLSRENHDSSLD